MFKLLVNGEDKTPLFQERLKRLTLTDNDGIDSDELVIELNDKNSDFAFPPTGARLAIAIGDSSLVDKGVFVVDEISVSGPPNIITISAKAADMTQELKSKRDKAWGDITLGVLINSIAAKYSLQTAISDEYATKQLDKLVQSNESDMHLLTRVSDALSLQCKYSHGVLAVTRKNATKTLSGLQLPIHSLKRSDAAQYTTTRADREAYKGVKTFFLDTDKGKRIKVETGESPHLYIPTLHTSEDEALSICNSEMQTLTKGAITGSVRSAKLTPAIAPGCKLKLEDFNEGLNGEWSVRSCVHTIDTKGRSVRVDFGYYSTN